MSCFQDEGGFFEKIKNKTKTNKQINKNTLNQCTKGGYSWQGKRSDEYILYN